MYVLLDQDSKNSLGQHWVKEPILNSDLWTTGQQRKQHSPCVYLWVGQDATCPVLKLSDILSPKEL